MPKRANMPGWRIIEESREITKIVGQRARVDYCKRGIQTTQVFNTKPCSRQEDVAGERVMY